MDEIKAIEAWLKRSDMSESRLGVLACDNARAVQRIRDGTATLATYWAVEAYIKANPAGKAKKKPKGAPK